MTPEELADKQLAAYNARDLDEFVACFVDDVPVYSFPAATEMEDRSRTAFRERFRKLFEQTPANHAELVSRVVKGSIVIDQERITRAGSSEVRHAVAIYEVGETRIERVWFVD